MKKALKLSLMLLIVCIMMVGNVYALTSNVNIKSSKTTIEEGEEITVEIYTSNLKSDDGVIAFSGILEYDKQKLTLVKFEGENEWETPTEGRTYNPSTGKIAINRSAPGKSDEGIFKIIFKAKEKIEGNATISLKDAMLADGMTTPVKVSSIKSDITIKQKAIDITPENPDNQETPGNPNDTTPGDSTNKPTTNPDNKTENTDKNNTNSGSNTNKTDNTIKNEKLPQTGDSNTTLMLLLGLIILAIIVFGIRMININRKLRSN